MFQAKNSWLAIPHSRMDGIEIGTAPKSKFIQEPNAPIYYSAWIPFGRSYIKIPSVECWISKIDVMSHPDPLRVRAWVTSATLLGMNIAIKVNEGNQVQDVSIGWIVYDPKVVKNVQADRASFTMGGMTTHKDMNDAFRYCRMSEPSPSVVVEYPDQVIRKPPLFMVGLNTVGFAVSNDSRSSELGCENAHQGRNHGQ